MLVAGLAVAGWLYATGRFGIGPLSAADKDAAAAIEDGVEPPEWSDADAVACAVDDLVGEHRSPGLEEIGVVEKDGDDWNYTETWEHDDAVAFYEEVLDCTDDWSQAVAETWSLEDADCLGDIGAATMGAWFAAENLTIDGDEDEVEKDRAAAVEELDDCYLATPALPTVTAARGYRSVQFALDVDDSDDSEGAEGVELSAGQPGNLEPVTRDVVRVETEEGGERACLTVQAQQTYAWGSTGTADAETCGTAKPKRIFWKKVRCTDEPGCYAAELRYEGFADYESITATYTSNGGNCLSTTGSCRDTVVTTSGGRGRVVTWTFPGSYSGTFVAKVGRLRTTLRN
ncbi:hypothetical protein GCM10025786_15870 [Nocardioides caeni]